MSANDLEVYTFQGNDEETVPKSVEKLIVSQGVYRVLDGTLYHSYRQLYRDKGGEIPENVKEIIGGKVLPYRLCYGYRQLQEVTIPFGLKVISSSAFSLCEKLSEIKIRSTVKFIKESAFSKCKCLATVEFEHSASSPHQLKTIERQAFEYCTSLQRIKLPSPVSAVGQKAFDSCHALVEANLSSTCVTEITLRTFHLCSSLQTVSLPKTLERIRNRVFYFCSALTTVVVPLHSQSITIDRESFYGCERLANFELPKGSVAASNAFTGCTLLENRYGSFYQEIVVGLKGRFENLPIHRMCYDHSGTTPEELRQCIKEQVGAENSFVDAFGMNALHVLCSTIEPKVELIEVLLDQYSFQILNQKDANGRRPFEYLINNFSDAAATSLESIFQKRMVDPIVNWGAMLWVEEIRTKVRAVLSEHDKERRVTLFNELNSVFGRYGEIESTSLLELALWKAKLKSGWSNDGSKRQALDRVECRCVSGSDIVIPRIAALLGVPRPPVTMERPVHEEWYA